MSCKHENFRVDAKVARIEDVGAFSVDLRIWCMDCNLPFEWVGLPGGFSHYQPCANIDCQEMRAPIVPQGGKVPEGLAGFRVTQTRMDEEPGTPQ
jgi:hypothetical protein